MKQPDVSFVYSRKIVILSSSLSKGVGVIYLVFFFSKVWMSFCILTVDRFIKYNQVLIVPKYKISANYN